MIEQLALFGVAGQSKGLPKHLLDYQAGLFSVKESDRLLEKFVSETPGSKRNRKCGRMNT